MTDWYSDHFGVDGNNDIVLPALPQIVPAGVSHGRRRVKRATITGLPLVTAPDVLRFFKMKSSDRLYKLELNCDGGSTAGAIDIGLHLAGSNHDGAAVDVDLFASAQSIASALDEQDVFGEATTLTGVDRGKQLWELANIGDATLTEDPQVDYEITATVTTSFTVADSELVLIAEYVGASD